MATKVCKLKWCKTHKRWEGRLDEEPIAFSHVEEALHYTRDYGVKFVPAITVPKQMKEYWCLIYGGG